MKQIYNKELEAQAMRDCVIQLNDLRNAQQCREGYFLGTAQRFSQQREDLRIKYLRYGKPFKPTIISIARISPWRMNGKPIRKNKIKAGIITEVR